jgi:endonuclease/exonuclease/phosphatase family metal-dependent hydrolase
MRILTWNILAQETLPEDAICWQQRLGKILQTILSIDADIILLQEVDLAMFNDDFAPLFDQWHRVSHMINKKRTLHFGNATLWRRELGECDQVIERSRCLHVRLANSKLIITNVHLPVGRGFEGCLNRMSHIESCKKVWQNAREIIMGGDFNESMSNPFGLVLDLRNFGFEFHDLPKLTCRTFSGHVHDIDHLCYKSVSFKFVGDPHLPSSLPYEIDENNPSDHIPCVYLIKCIN